jgi:hypothetical protein
MKNSKLLMKVLVLLLGVQINAFAMQMQHGFILSNNDSLGSHLVANGHHSRQVEIIGKLTIQDSNELSYYRSRKSKNTNNQSYFLFQSQQLDLPNLKVGMVLTGHIVESRTGNYEPQNKIVKSATFHVQKVLLNLPNPFFAGGGH